MHCESCMAMFTTGWALQVHLNRSSCGTRKGDSRVRFGDVAMSVDPMDLAEGEQKGLERMEEATRRRSLLSALGALKRPSPSVPDVPDGPRRQLDNVLLEDPDSYWESVQPPLDETLPASHGLLGRNTVEEADPGPISEFIAEGEELIVQIAEKAGRKQVDRLLTMCTSKEWVDLFSWKLSPEAATAASFAQRGSSLASVSSATSAAERRTELFLKNLGFKTRRIFRDGNDGPNLKVHMRSPVKVLTNLLEKASAAQRNFFFDPVVLTNRAGERVTSHPMSGAVAHLAIPAVKAQICVSDDPTVFWSGNSFVVLVQLYSDKSAMSLKSDSFSFYPLHLCPLGFSSTKKEQFIRQGDTVVAYLPVAGSWTSEREDRSRQFEKSGEPVPVKSFQDSDMRQPKSSAGWLPNPPETRPILEKALRCALGELREKAAAGIEFLDADGVRRKAHVVLASYTADTPEVSTIVCTKLNRCPRCDVPIQKMGRPGVTGARRCAAHTDQMLFLDTISSLPEIPPLLLENRADKDVLLHLANDFSTYASESGVTRTRPYFIDWPLSAAHPSLDMYRIARFDLMHNMPLGLLKELISLVTKRLKSQDLTAPRCRDAKGIPRKLRYLRKRLLHAANAMLTLFGVECPTANFNVDFSRGKTTDTLDGLFTDNGVASMLEARDLKDVQQVLPFVGAFLDRLIGDVGCNASPFTKVFVSYHDLYRRLSRKDQDEVGFSDRSLVELERCIQKFKRLAVKVFGDFQASAWNFPKFHALEHVVDDIRDIGSPCHFSADPFEASHTLFKSKNRSTSRRKASTLEETTAKLAREQGMRSARDRANQSQHQPHEVDLQVGRQAVALHRLPSSGCDAGDERVRNTARLASSSRPLGDTGGIGEGVFDAMPQNMTPNNAAIVRDMCCLSRARGRAYSFAELSRAIVRCSASNQAKEAPVTLQSLKNSPSELSGGERFVASLGGHALAKKALDIIAEKATDQINSDFGARLILNSLRIHFVSSAHVAGFPTPSAAELHEEENDVYLVDDGSRCLQKVVSSVSYSHSSAVRQDSVMVERGVSEEEEEGNADGSCKRNDSMPVWFAKVLTFFHIAATSGPFQEGEELAVVRYYEAIPRVDFEEVDDVLDSVKLRWSPDRHGDPWIDVIPASSIRGRVHVVPGNLPPSVFSTTDLGQDEEGICGDEILASDESLGAACFVDSADWERRWFYVNKYKFTGKGEHQYNVADLSPMNTIGVTNT